MGRVHPVSAEALSKDRLTSVIIKLWVREVGQSHLRGVSQIVGSSIMVGTRIFNIVRGLGYGGGLFHEFGK